MPIYILNNAYKKRNKKYTYVYEPGRGLPRRPKPDTGIKSQPCHLVDPPPEFDEEGKELGPDAQVWKAYVREADRVDEELVDGWNKSMDVNLIFAALFSAISTAFVIESYKNLKQDPADVSAQALLVISQTLSSLTNAPQPAASTPIPFEEAAPFRAAPSAIFVNVLWFLSLSLSVAVSLISMLAKEWCLEFMSGRIGPPGAQARRRQRRWDALESWRMKEVLTMLPSLIHLSLLLFAIGLCVFLWDVHYGVAIPVVIVTTLAAGAYFACTILPFIDNYCPYGTVLSRLYKSFSSGYSPSVGDGGIQDETTGQALHWMIVNCETPRSVDVALQSLAGAEKGLPPTMLEKCDAWTLIRQRVDSIDPTGEKAESVSLLYRRGLDCHFKMRTGNDKSHDWNREFQRLLPLVLGLQGCVNSIIFKVLEQLRLSDRNRSILEQCTWIGPRLLHFEYGPDLIDKDTPWGSIMGEYGGDMHAERSEALAESIIQLLAQHMTGEVRTEPVIQSALSACLLLLLSGRVASNPSAASVYIKRLIRAYRPQVSTGSEHTRIRVDHNEAANQSNRITFALLLGAMAVANVNCFVRHSPGLPGSLPASSIPGNKTHRMEKVIELGWHCLISAAYPGTLSFNDSHYLVHGISHFLARAKEYNLSARDCTFIRDLLGDNWLYTIRPSEEDEYCLTYHIEELANSLATNLDLDALTAPLLTCLTMLPWMNYGHQRLQPTPETYVFVVRVICWECKSGTSTDYISLISRFPFPKASQKLTHLLSNQGVFQQLLSLLDSEGFFGRAFAVAQIWLLLHMSLQVPDCRSSTSSKLAAMLLVYPDLQHDLSNKDTVMKCLESRLLDLVDSDEHTNIFDGNQARYLCRVLECMLQMRCTPLPEYVHQMLDNAPWELRGIGSFVDLEVEVADPSPNDNFGCKVTPSDPEPTVKSQAITSFPLHMATDSNDQDPVAK
ncbi:unnamed protein product [Rhizoctonia solani]|uniref:DUF6535 domain-containing protein n=1 Tax=Rhizoctonia solani TaxID=456999 RepID=A0A8H3AMW5_9AGAM|nr:unnamed protein product [Rhizoctonia solani]